jgi:predicted nucleic acid-binding protein
VIVTLVDTSVWIDHFRRGSRLLSDMLEAGVVAAHPFVLGELACGTLQNRDEVLASLDALPSVPLLPDAEVRHLVEARRIWGLGLGWVDAHVLGSALVAGVSLWTLDRALSTVAAEVGVGVE